MGRYTWLLDPGHGGLIDGVYQTAGKRSPELPDGRILYEGVFNRQVASQLADFGSGDVYVRLKNARAHQAKLDIINLVDTDKDLSLRSRVREANRIHKEKKNCIYVSIHANAFGNGRDFNSAGGVVTFHHYRSSKGKKLATVLQKELAYYTPFRDRGVRANETWANFYVLRKTHMPAVLSENGFMTNLKDAENLLDPGVVTNVAKAHLEMILEIEENGL
jgi:N-acetylmuramoyl-L-alanine amidase